MVARDSVQLHYGKDDFDSAERLAHTLGREQSKDMALDYARARERFAATRGYNRSRLLDTLAKDQLVEPERSAPERRDPFAGLRLRVERAPDAGKTVRSPFDNLKLQRGDGVERAAASPPSRHPSGLGLGDGPSDRVAGAALDRAVQEHARAYQDMARMTDQGMLAPIARKSRVTAALGAVQFLKDNVCVLCA